MGLKPSGVRTGVPAAKPMMGKLGNGWSGMVGSSRFRGFTNSCSSAILASSLSVALARPVPSPLSNKDWQGVRPGLPDQHEALDERWRLILLSVSSAAGAQPFWSGGAMVEAPGRGWGIAAPGSAACTKVAGAA
jgi:hypothetical protein